MTSVVDKYYRRIIQNIDNIRMKFDISSLLVKSKEHDSKINTNESDISSNLSKIETNESNISYNLSLIIQIKVTQPIVKIFLKLIKRKVNLIQHQLIIIKMIFLLIYH